MSNSVVDRWYALIGRAKPDAPLATLAAVLAVGALLAAAFGFKNPNASTELLVAVFLATVLVGGLAGFLFGLPRFQYASGTAPAVVPPVTATPPAPATTGSAPVTPTRTGEYTPSTNLDEIANWLTKIIIGATLVQIKDIGRVISDISGFVVAPCAPGCTQFGHPFVASLIVLAFVAGFLFGYLWTRLHYGGIAAEADATIFKIIAQKETDLATRYGVGGKASGRSMDEFPSDAANLDWIENATSSDPNKGRFGGSPIANGRVLSATFAPAESRPGITRVTLAVASLDPKKPLEGAVTFDLHPTFKQREVRCPVVNGKATLTVLAWGAFTVGATTDDGTTLELDLAEQPTAPLEFRQR